MEQESKSFFDKLKDLEKLDWDKHASPELKRKGRQTEAIINIIFQALFVAAANYFYDKLDFINAELFLQVLPLINIAAMVSITMQSVSIIQPTKMMRSAANLVGLIFSMVILWNLIQIYPFDLSGLWDGGDLDSIARIGMAIALFATGIGLIVEFGKLMWQMGETEETVKAGKE